MLVALVAVATEVPFVPHTPDDPDVCPATPFGPGPTEWPTSTDLMVGVGHAGPYFPYDIEDPRAPALREKRAPGFVTVDDYVRGGVVKQYKSRRPPKRANRRKR